VFAPETRDLINHVAYELVCQGKPQREALFLVTDCRKKVELEAVLESAKRRQMPCPACAA
jgi:hypothetical protein